MNLKDKAHKEGQYQDIEVKGEKIVSGWRLCDDRWELIKPFITNKQLYMDIGSHYGYFGVKIAEEYPESLVWSIEPYKERYEIQKEVIKANELKNMVLTTKKINILELLKLKQSCEAIDMIICLSTLHYFPKDEQLYIIYLFSQIAHKLIIEYPSVKEKNCAEKQNVYSEEDFGRIIGQNYSNNYPIGKIKSPNGSTERIIYFAENKNIKRKQVLNAIGLLSNHKLNLEYNGHWNIGKGDFEIGINNFDLLYHEVILPEKDLIFTEVARAYKKLIDKVIPTDISIANSLYTPYGMKIIDYSEAFNADALGCTFEHYMKCCREISHKNLTAELKDKYELFGR
jgi:hypothetical protein